MTRARANGGGRFQGIRSRQITRSRVAAYPTIATTADATTRTATSSPDAVPPPQHGSKVTFASCSIPILQTPAGGGLFRTPPAPRLLNPEPETDHRWLRNRGAIPHGRTIDPAAHCQDRGIAEHSRPTHHADSRHPPVGLDRRRQDYIAVHATQGREARILGRKARNQGHWLQSRNELRASRPPSGGRKDEKGHRAHHATAAITSRYSESTTVRSSPAFSPSDQRSTNSRRSTSWPAMSRAAKARDIGP